MYQLVIADDDELIRNGLTRVVKWTELGFEVAASVVSGTQALENIEMKGNFTSIGQELKNIELYMTLAKLRYRTRLHYFIEVDQTLYDLQIIKLLLQPLVENSMKYGRDQISGDEHIHLWIGEEDESIVVSLSDDGVGMSQEQLDNIRSLWENIGEYREDVRRVGLYNIMRRLYLCYKDDCSFEIFSEENNGTNIVNTYPRKRYMPEE